MDQMAAAAYAAETERLLLAFAVETDELEREVANAAIVQWESPAANAFRQQLLAVAQRFPDVSLQLRSAAGELRQDPLMLAAGS
ncbi:hypothetical protein [Arthrobacter sp. zg-Y769]|uniref:hypothetical protein n=1 Tax=Arthrobacter sp. zg-Y769 TaxID=2894191 RepID=UPI001E3C62E8|nr:hypothetical protein [Arthrobacter sp. zg-Y769]MCC9205840.1 hypothetical protein [Arthrobacter sp. zg-Y769]